MPEPPTDKQKEARLHNWNKAQMKCAHAICYRSLNFDKKMSSKQKVLLDKALNIFEEILQCWDEERKDGLSRKD